jgi:hypothetical protein
VCLIVTDLETFTMRRPKPVFGCVTTVKGKKEFVLTRRKFLPYFIHSYPVVREHHYRPGQALRVPGGLGSQISTQSAHEGGKVVSPTHRLPLQPRKYSWYSFLLDAESTPRP